MTVEATQHRRDPHDILGVPRGADRQQVMQAFRRKAKQGSHPDTGGNTQTFEEIIRARDALLEPARPATNLSSRRTAPVARPPKTRPSPAKPPPDTASPAETSKLAIATGVLALLGPLFWPVAIMFGHLALRHIQRTGKGGGTLVRATLFLVYLLTLCALAFTLTVTIDPQ
jgi:DnaJ domain